MYGARSHLGPHLFLLLPSLPLVPLGMLHSRSTRMTSRGTVTTQTAAMPDEGRRLWGSSRNTNLSSHPAPLGHSQRTKDKALSHTVEHVIIIISRPGCQPRHFVCQVPGSSSAGRETSASLIASEGKWSSTLTQPSPLP